MNTIKLNTIGTPKVRGGNSGGGGSSWKYFKIKQDADFSDGSYLYDVYRAIVMSSFFLTLGDDGYYPTYSSAFMAWSEKELGGKLIAIGFDTEQYTLDVFDSWETMKIGDLWENYKINFMEYLFEKEISKEEYYQLHTLNWN